MGRLWAGAFGECVTDRLAEHIDVRGIMLLAFGRVNVDERGYCNRAVAGRSRGPGLGLRRNAGRTARKGAGQ